MELTKKGMQTERLRYHTNRLLVVVAGEVRHLHVHPLRVIAVDVLFGLRLIDRKRVSCIVHFTTRILFLMIFVSIIAILPTPRRLLSCALVKDGHEGQDETQTGLKTQHDIHATINVVIAGDTDEKIFDQLDTQEDINR